MDDKKQITCSKCHTEKKTNQTARGLPRLPRGWKRHGQIYCGDCWDRLYMLRAVTMRVAGPWRPPTIDGPALTWADLRAALKEAWGEQTRLVNWMVDQLYDRDVRREPGQKKLQPMPRVYLYPEARELFAHLPSVTVSATEQQVKSKWMAKRYKVLWLHEEHLPRTNYPAPLPIPAANWSLAVTDDARRDMIVSVPLGNLRWALRLVGGHRYRRQRAMLEGILRGDVIPCEMQLYRKRTGGSDRAGRNGQGSAHQIIDRDSGGQRAMYDVMCKIVVWLPRAETAALDGTLYLRTDTESLLVALDVKDERLWVEHADHIQRLVQGINAHTRALNRLSDDAKAEQRPIPKFASRRQILVGKQHRRMRSWIAELVAHVVGYARRRRFATIVYDDSDRGFVHRFPWHELRQQLAAKADEYGIEFQLASGQVAEKVQEPLAEEEE